jgi:Protein of unknown function (DUF2911)
MNLKTFPFFAAGCGLLLASSVMAATPKVDFPQASPACTIKQRVGITDIEVDYSRPGVKDREIFGTVVPYDQVWRTGANQATKIIFSRPVTLNGTEIPAGTYALMTIPGKDEWTIIINKGSEQWGAYKYDEKADVARIKATPVALDKVVDAFTIEFNKIRDESADLNLVWDKVEVPIKVEAKFVDKLVSQVEDVMASDAKEKPYFQAARFYYDHDLDMNKAKKWVDAAIAEKDLFYMDYLKAQILAKLGDKKAAIETAKHSSELAEKAHESTFVRLNSEFIAGLK